MPQIEMFGWKQNKNDRKIIRISYPSNDSVIDSFIRTNLSKPIHEVETCGNRCVYLRHSVRNNSKLERSLSVLRSDGHDPKVAMYQETRTYQYMGYL